MGRGRQKAKHTKVARELKYFTPDTNLTALERELAAAAHAEEYEDKWAHLVDDEDDLDDDELDEDDAANPTAQTA
ncbi:DUF3073 domain-containing protein [Microcella humidisoli]|uniref:DUF3073 domain-containing protein n=1 Tax=Microcella humidisoli TaxID=2963406 RepID=A0ABY5FYK1_9MICO|nr:DUF3073 domain-containing protein [Microcella humidisoli]UTT63374.1 DUF3073 domain-containing protein [Microcella humidisoli]